MVGFHSGIGFVVLALAAVDDVIKIAIENKINIFFIVLRLIHSYNILFLYQSKI